MAFDACMMRAQLSEFSREFPEAKIEKVLQPANDEIDLAIHYGKSSRRLLFNVGPNAPRLQLTDTAKENPKVPPMFCMYLRKRLTGARIIGVSQPSFDRIAEFKISGYDEMGFPTQMTAVCEIMGKYANFILLDGERKILNALKIIDFSASTVRQVLPGFVYTAPAMQNKHSPLEISARSRCSFSKGKERGKIYHLAFFGCGNADSARALLPCDRNDGRAYVRGKRRYAGFGSSRLAEASHRGTLYAYCGTR